MLTRAGGTVTRGRVLAGGLAGFRDGDFVDRDLAILFQRDLFDLAGAGGFLERFGGGLRDFCQLRGDGGVIGV